MQVAHVVMGEPKKVGEESGETWRGKQVNVASQEFHCVTKLDQIQWLEPSNSLCNLIIILWLKIVDPTTKRMAQICDPSLQVATCIDIQEHPQSIYS